MRLPLRFRPFIPLLVAALLALLTATVWGLAGTDQGIRGKKIIARWVITGKGQIEEAFARNIDVLEDHPSAAKGYFTILVDASQLAELQAAGYQIQVVTSDWYKSYAAGAQVPNGGFRTVAQCVALMDSIHTAHPTITSAKFSLGTTYEGRDMWAMKISSSPGADNGTPEIFFNGMHHAREPIGMEILLETMKRLTDGYGTDTLMTRLVNERQIYFMPISNPDGYQFNIDSFPSGGGMWRKNRDNSYTSVGVDLNRNYGYQFGYDNVGSSPNPASEIYRGPYAFSEPETQNIRTFINAHHFVFDVNYHSYSNLLLWPWGYSTIYTPDNTLFQGLGDSMASYNCFTPQVSWMLYKTNGDIDDWAYGATGEHTKILSFTPEVGAAGDNTTTGNGFWPDPVMIPFQVNECQGMNLAYIDLAATPDRVFPPSLPAWTGPDTVTAADYTLQWSDPGSAGVNRAVSFQLHEAFGVHHGTDDAESDNGMWRLIGWSRSIDQAASGTHSYWGGNGNARKSRMISARYLQVQPNDSLRIKVWYDLEQNWDYAYVEASTNGGQSWVTLPGNITTMYNPQGRNRGNGITGTSSGAFVNGKFSLNAYAGQNIFIRFSYETDDATLGAGIYVDDISPLTLYDSSKVLAAATPLTTYGVTGKQPGDYYYTLTAADADGQLRGETPPHRVHVSYSTCSCPCHADPQCDSVTDVLDVIGTVNVAFRGAPAVADPNCPRVRTDLDCNGTTDVLDVVRMVTVAFRGGTPAANFCNACGP